MLTCSLFPLQPHRALSSLVLETGPLHHILVASPDRLRTSLHSSLSTSRWHCLTTSARTTLSLPVSTHGLLQSVISLSWRILWFPGSALRPSLHRLLGFSRSPFSGLQGLLLFTLVWVFRVLLTGSSKVVLLSSWRWCNE